MRGPRKKKLRIVGGKQRENEHLVITTASDVAISSCPAYLGEIGSQVWRELASELKKAGILADIDLRLLESYCISYEAARLAYESVKKDGITLQHESRGLIINPAVGAWREAAAEMRQTGALLGCDPMSRRRLTISTSEPAGNEFTDL